MHCCRLLLALYACVFATNLAYAEVILFADDQQITERTAVKRVVRPAIKLAEPVIRGDEKWEQNPYAYGSFAYDEQAGTYKAWYQTINSGVSIRTPILYNLSKDGHEWSRPNLGIVDFEGSTNNNILIKLQRLCSPSVIKVSDQVDSEYPYRMAYWDIRKGSTYDGWGGMYTALSKDGVHWQNDCERPRLVAEKKMNSTSDVLDLMYDSDTGKYVAHAKCWKWDGEKPLYRMICRSESADFREWSTPEVIFDPRSQDDSQPQTYGMPVFKYQGEYFGLLRVYHKPGNETIEIELAHSRDDKTWERIAPGTAFLPVGESGTWDDGMVFAAPPVVRNDEMSFYYGGWDGPHNVGGRKAYIGLATTPVGRLVALTPDNDSGTIVTKLLNKSDLTNLTVNLDARQGMVRFSLLDKDGSPVPGFGLEESTVFQGDSLTYSPRWTGTNETTALPNQLYLQIELSGKAYLYELRY